MFKRHPSHDGVTEEMKIGLCMYDRRLEVCVEDDQQFLALRMIVSRPFCMRQLPTRVAGGLTPAGDREFSPHDVGTRSDLRGELSGPCAWS